MAELENQALCYRAFQRVVFCSEKRNRQKATSIRDIEVLKGLGANGGSVAPYKDSNNSTCHQKSPNKTCPAQRQAFFCFRLNIEPVGFVATKKMTLLSGNPDGFVFQVKFIEKNRLSL